MGFNDARDYGEPQTDPDRSYLDIATDTARAGAQGLTFGYADEIEAAITAGISGSESYGEALARVRGNIKKFQQDNPRVAFGAEITGAIIPSIVAQLVPVGGQVASAANATRIATALANNPVTRAAATGAVASGIYGAGTAEGGAEERLMGALKAAPIGAVANPALQKVAPAITAGARDLIRKGVQLTPGQAVRGSSLLGNAFSRAEEAIGSTVPIVGDAIRGALGRAQKTFNVAAVNEALAPIGAKVGKKLEGAELIQAGNKILGDEYDKLLPQLKITNRGQLSSELKSLVTGLEKDISKDVRDRLQRYIFNRFDDAGMSGDNIKKAQTFLRRDIERLRRQGDEVAARQVDALEDVRSIFNRVIEGENPAKLSARLRDLDGAYGNFQVISAASMRRKADEAFTPVDVLQASAKSDPARTKRATAEGRARMQPFARQAQNVMGSQVPDSGTTARQMTASALLGGTGSQMGLDMLSGGSLIALPTAAYSSPIGNMLARELLGAGGQAVRRSVPFAANEAAQQDLDMFSRFRSPNAR